MEKAGSLLGSSHASIHTNKAVLVYNLFYSNSGKILSFLQLEGSYNRCNSVRLGRNLLILDSSMNMSCPAVPPAMDPLKKGHPIWVQADNATIVAGGIQYIIHQGGERSLAALRETSKILSWTETHYPAISAAHIPGVDKWQVDLSQPPQNEPRWMVSSNRCVKSDMPKNCWSWMWTS